MALTTVDKLRVPNLCVSIIDRPDRALASVVAYPRWRWLAPAILAVVGIGVYAVVSAPHLAAQAQQAAAQQLSRLSASQAAQAQQAMAVLQSPLLIGGVALLTGTIGLAIGWLIQSAILYFGSLIAGGSLEYSGVLAATPWLAVPLSLEMLLQSAYVALRGRLVTNPGLSYLVSSGNATADARNLAWVALSQASLFQLWHLVLVYMLLRTAGRFSRMSALWLTVIFEALLIGGQLALAALGRLARPGL